MACVWAIERLLWGPSGAGGITSSGKYTPGEYVRVWVSSVSPGDANDISESWEWLPFCWPPHYDDARPRATSLYDVVTGRTSGATVYTLPVVDTSKQRAIDPDLYPRPPSSAIIQLTEWKNKLACELDFSRYTSTRTQVVVDRWAAIASNGGMIDAEVDGGMPVLWLRDAYDDGRQPSFRPGIPLGASGDNGGVYTHHSFMVWLEPGTDNGIVNANQATIVRVTVEPSGLISWPPPQSSAAALEKGGNATTLRWTWDVSLVHSALPSSRRLDVFFRLKGAAVQGPFLIVSVALACIVSLLSTVYLVRTLGQRIASSVYPVGGKRLSKLLSDKETVGREWVMCGLAGEHFRRPRRAARLLAALVGTGLQLQVLVISVFLLGGAGILWVRVSTYGGDNGASPIDRLASLGIVLLLATHLVSGATSARIRFRWDYHERTLRKPGEMARALLPEEVDVPLESRDEGAGVGDEEAGDGVPDDDMSTASWKDVRGTPAFVVERILQDWGGIYVDVRTGLLTAMVLPFGSAPLYVPLIMLAGGNGRTLAAAVAGWFILAWGLSTVGAHAAVAWAAIPDDAPRPILARHSESGHIGWGLGVLAPLFLGLVSFLGGGMLACLAFMLALNAGGYVSVFPFLAAAFGLWLYQSRVVAVLVAWRRLRNRNWHWHWAAWGNGVAVVPILVFVFGLGGQIIVAPATLRAAAVIWLTASLAAVWLALAHASAAYLRVADFLVMAFGRVANAMAQE